MYGLNFSLFSMNCGAKAEPSAQLADVLGAIDDHQLALLVEEAGVAGPQPAAVDVSVSRVTSSCLK